MEGLPELELYGFLPRDKGLEIPSRHLGLLTEGDFSPEHPMAPALGTLDRGELSTGPPALQRQVRWIGKGSWTELRPGPAHTRIAVAMDEAFCFYYAENLRLLRDAGAELVPFSPIRSRRLPEGTQGIFLGGGYPGAPLQTPFEQP